jgi:hypothetical protein
MIWLILYLIIAFAIFVALLCLCCIEYKKITNPYLSFKYWMYREDNWCIIPVSFFWIITLPLFIVCQIALLIVNLVLKYFDIEPIRVWS